MSPLPDAEVCYRAIQGRDARFDGWFVVGVTSTGIYCRPSCPARTPRRANVRFFASAAAAQGDGFRACMRCRPDAAPGSPEWDARSDLVARAMRMIGDGVVERDGVPGLARRLGYTERHLTRMVRAELGAGPLAIARARRAQTARILIETTPLPFAQVAFAAGFASIRQFNSTIREVYALTPRELRARGRAGDEAGPGAVSLRLAYRAPHDLDAAFGFLAARAVAGVEVADGGSYRRVLRLPGGLGRVTLAPADGHVARRAALDDLRDLGAAVARCRRILDLDADPVAVDAALSEDPVLAPLVARRPGAADPGGGRRLGGGGARGGGPGRVGRRRADDAGPDGRGARRAGGGRGRTARRARLPGAGGAGGRAGRRAADDGRAPARRCAPWRRRWRRASCRWSRATTRRASGRACWRCRASDRGPPATWRCGCGRTRTRSCRPTWRRGAPRRAWGCRTTRPGSPPAPSGGARGAATRCCTCGHPERRR